MKRAIACMATAVALACPADSLKGDWTGATDGSQALLIVLNAEGIRPGPVSTERLVAIAHEAGDIQSGFVLVELTERTLSLLHAGVLSPDSALQIAEAIRVSGRLAQGVDLLPRQIEQNASLARSSRADLASFLRTVIEYGSWSPRVHEFGKKQYVLSAVAAIEIAGRCGFVELLDVSRAFLERDPVARQRWEVEARVAEEVSIRVLQAKAGGPDAAMIELARSWSGARSGVEIFDERLDWELASYVAREKSRAGDVSGISRLTRAPGTSPGLAKLGPERAAARASLFERFREGAQEGSQWRLVEDAERALFVGDSTSGRR